MQKIHSHIQHLVKKAEKIASKSLKDGKNSDEVYLFPEKTLFKIRKASLLNACTRKNEGGLNLGLAAGTNLALLNILKFIGSGNLVMGRVLEGHINAQLLINQVGTKNQKSRLADDAQKGHLFAVWNTQAKDGTTLTKKKNGDYILKGAKIFATGSGYVSRALVTASLKDGSLQMCVVNLDEAKTRSDSSWWFPMGMKSSRSYKITFEKVLIRKENLLGKAGNYYKQPAFSGGAVRFAAVQMGAAEMLLHETVKYLSALKRLDDPYQKMRIGKMTIAVTSGNQWIIGAANEMDRYMKTPTEKNADLFLAYANMMRNVIEEICTEVMALCQKCVGARGLNHPYHFERIIRDLNTYLRQSAPDTSLAEVGKFALAKGSDVKKMWNYKKGNNGIKLK